MSDILFSAADMSQERDRRTALRLAGHLGLTIADARRGRAWTLRDLSKRTGIAISWLHAVEHGQPASIETYAVIAGALGQELRLDLVDPRARRNLARSEDPVHAVMGEVIAERLSLGGSTVALDEPYQHYQFAGRADVLAWNVERRALLHVENRTRFPNLQEAMGAYNAKRRYLPGVIAERIGIRNGFDSVTHVIAGLWSSEIIHVIRLRPASFRAIAAQWARAVSIVVDRRATASGSHELLRLVRSRARRPPASLRRPG